MKTAISIPDKVFVSAEKLAKQLGQSRSQLYTTAVSAYVQQQDGQAITKKLDEVYANTGNSLDPVLRKLQARSLPKDKW